MTGTMLTITGLVVSTDCTPIPGALIDFWQCDDAGNYDNVGYRLRGHQFTDSAGAYTLETIVPGIYPGRTRHIHVKVQAPGQPVLTTQLFFPGEPQNARDSIYRQECEITVVRSTPAMDATFDFVLDVPAGSVPRT
jgi:protocatechuate 3,4-dioxygenase beta subunit